MQVCTSGTDHTFRRIDVSTGKLNWWYLCYESQINNTHFYYENQINNVHCHSIWLKS